MRALRVAALVAVIVAATLPATAQIPSVGVTVGMDSSADAYWESVQDVSDTQVRITVHYLGASDGNEGWSQYFSGSILCDKTDDPGDPVPVPLGSTSEDSPPPPGEDEPVACVTESWQEGTSYPGMFKLTMNPLLLRSAHLQGEYWVQSYDPEGNPIDEEGSLVSIAADWTPNGRTQRGGGTWSYRYGCTLYVSHYEGAYRPADASATVGDVDLGQSTFGNMGTGLGVDAQTEC